MGHIIAFLIAIAVAALIFWAERKQIRKEQEAAAAFVAKLRQTQKEPVTEAEQLRRAISSAQYYEQGRVSIQEYATMRDQQLEELKLVVLHVMDEDWPYEDLSAQEFIRQELTKIFGTSTFPWIKIPPEND